jgi:hypothetical protein
MYTLLSKLAEIAASFVTRFFDHRGVSQDAEIAGHVVRMIVALQDICTRGERILMAASNLVDDPTRTDHGADFEKLIGVQRQALGTLAGQLNNLKDLLATIDVQISLDLTLVLDTKSGILTRWQQQVDQSRFSTTSLFFLPPASLGRVLEIGRKQATPQGLIVSREDFVLAVADQLRDARSREVRDIRSAAQPARRLVQDEIAVARTELQRTKELCSHLRDSAETALGKEAFARLRRKLAPKAPDASSS